MKSSFPVSRRFLRSVNLSRDCHSEEGVNGYVVTPSVRATLSRIVQGLSGSRRDRAFTITGPYGSGKSSFALFLFHLLRCRDGMVWTLLRKADAALAKEVAHIIWPTPKSKGYACLPATAAVRESVPELLADAIDAFCGTLPRMVPALSRQLREARDSRDALRLVEAISESFMKAGYAGLLFVFDEFGRVFETARLHPTETDVSLLQDMAEVASRSGVAGLALIGILHQGFGDYAVSDPSLRREFSKIEGRFDPISFSEPPASQIQLVAAAIAAEDPVANDDDALIKAVIKANVPALAGLSDEVFRRCAIAARPLHPLALVALPVLFRRLGQNERSVFSFLAGREPGSLPSLCDSEEAIRHVCLDHLFDYLFANFESHLSLHSFGQALLEANAALSAKPELSCTEKRTIKAVALLSSLGTQCPIGATQELVALSLLPDDSLGQSLDDLLRQSILVYRRFNKTYALWNGSDIDLRECERRADEELGKTGFSLAETLERFVPPAPMVAKRHSLETGCLRYFETRYADCPGELEASIQKRTSAAGLLVVCLPERRSEIETFIEDAKRLSQGDASLLFAIPRECDDLRDALKEVRRLHWIEDHEKALRDDRIASREVSVRLAEATQSVQRRQFGLLDPAPSPHGVECMFVHAGETLSDIRSGRDFARCLSAICDNLYPASPRVLNEHVNRRMPSSQAAAARKNLVTRLNNPDTCKLPLLGIEGYPPERSIYESVILASGMHVTGPEGAWQLAAPAPNAPTNLRPAWEKLAEIVFAPHEKPVSVKGIYEELRRPPYGMLDGLLPLLVIAFLLVERDEVFFYYEGTFQPEPTDAHFEVLFRRPELFALSGMRVSGTRAAIVERLAAGLGARSETIMPVVRKLYGLRNSLSKYALETDSVSERAKAFRKAFEDAKAPDALLFRTLPSVFGLGDIATSRLDQEQLDRYFEGLNACFHELGSALPALVSDSRRHLLEAFEFENDEAGWRTLYDRSCYLLARIGSSDLVPFLQNVKNTDGDWNKAGQVMAYIESSPMEKWGPLQIGEFGRAIVGLAERFKAAWRPYDGTALLSAKDEKAAANLLSGIQAAAKKQKTGRTALRAALLRALAELDGTEVHT